MTQKIKDHSEQEHMPGGLHGKSTRGGSGRHQPPPLMLCQVRKPILPSCSPDRPRPPPKVLDWFYCGFVNYAHGKRLIFPATALIDNWGKLGADFQDDPVQLGQSLILWVVACNPAVTA